MWIQLKNLNHKIRGGGKWHMEFVIEVMNKPALQPDGSDRNQVGSMLSGHKALVTPIS